MTLGKQLLPLRKRGLYLGSVSLADLHYWPKRSRALEGPTRIHCETALDVTKVVRNNIFDGYHLMARLLSQTCKCLAKVLKSEVRAIVCCAYIVVEPGMNHGLDQCIHQTRSPDPIADHKLPNLIVHCALKTAADFCRTSPRQ